MQTDDLTRGAWVANSFKATLVDVPQRTDARAMHCPQRRACPNILALRRYPKLRIAIAPDSSSPGERPVQPDHFQFWPAHLPREMPLPETSLYRNLEATANRFPDKPAVQYYGTPLTYRKLKDEADVLAGFLQQRAGVKRGERILLFMQNSPQFIIAFYAILLADAMVVPINPMNLTEELRHYVGDSDARVAIIGQELLAQVRPLIGAGLHHVIVAAYSDYRTQSTDLKIPDVVATPRQLLREPGVTV